ncbi:MAG: hypothetical protein ACRDH5_01565, partial [bacterium]
MRRTLTTALAATLLLAGCSQEPTAAGDELALAQSAQLIAQDVAATSRTTHESWIHRLLDTLRTTDNAEALAFLEQARAYRDSARAAWEAGDAAAARAYARLAFRAVLSAVLEIYPNAPERTGLAVD